MINLRNYLIDRLNDCIYLELENLGQYGIEVSRDDRYPKLFNLKYGIVSADKSDPLVCACRGAVVERVDDDGDHSPYFRLVAYAFDRFFNYGEYGAAQVDWQSAKVWEKMDGSLIKVFYYKGEWIVSTSGSVAGGSKVGETEKSFSELFWEVFNQVGYSKDVLKPNLCYIFELCHKSNRIVVAYDKPQLPLLAVRDRLLNFDEVDVEEVGHSHGFKVVERYDFGEKELIHMVNLRGANHEGFVVCDAMGNRLKIKSSIYCQLHAAVSNGNPNFSELYLKGDLEEFLLYFPEYVPKFQPYLEKIEFFRKISENFVRDNNHLNQKDFALKVIKEYPSVSGPVFSIRSGESRNFMHFIEKLTPNKLSKLLRG